MEIMLKFKLKNIFEIMKLNMIIVLAKIYLYFNQLPSLHCSSIFFDGVIVGFLLSGYSIFRWGESSKYHVTI